MSVADLDPNSQQAHRGHHDLHDAGLRALAAPGRQGPAVANGAAIWHPGPGYGDGYNWNIFADWDKDGKIDILSGTQQGNVYFHKTGRRQQSCLRRWQQASR
jgi:hypothetical protein